MTEEQSQVLAFLEREAFSDPVERIDTHAAVVLLVGDRAYKMKRAVRYSFLDFSTLENRRRVLERELALNRRTAPDLYLGLVPVVRRPDGRLGLGGEGEPVEWLLEMRRFPSEHRLDRLASAGRLSLELVEILARDIVRFHRAAVVRPDKGGAFAIRKVIAGNASDLRELASELAAGEAIERVLAATERRFEALRDLLDVRRGAGRVRHCHGDLHLENIALVDGRPVLFDCLEFDEDLACIDVLYDLAFLIMDLWERGLPQHAHRLLQAWNDDMVEDAGLQSLPLFLALRAQVRAKVEGFTARLQSRAEDRTAHLARARGYLELAQLALEQAPPRLVAIGGASGSGKSSLAFALAPVLGPLPGAMLLRSDVIRKRLFGRAPHEPLPEHAYRAEVSAEVFEIIANRAATLLEAGWSVICDAVYGKGEQRRRIEEVARELRVPFDGLWLEAPLEVLVERVEGRGRDVSDADAQVVRQQIGQLDTAGLAWRRINAARPLSEVVAEARTVLEV